MYPFEKKENTPNFSNPAACQAFVSDTTSRKALFQKEFDVNQAEQNLLEKRIRMMKDFINDIPASDPQYSMLVAQVQMDRIELDELKVRETLLIQKIAEI
ncbi:MAG: hypothetical protein V4487_00300 [Chlamydiota bacterium]